MQSALCSNKDSSWIGHQGKVQQNKNTVLYFPTLLF